MTDIAVGKPLPNTAGLRLADYLAKHNSTLLDPEWQEWQQRQCSRLGTDYILVVCKHAAIKEDV